VIGDTEMQNAPPVVRQHQEHVENLEPDGPTLNNKNLEVAAGSGLPVHLLICDDENLGDPTPLRFVKRAQQICSRRHRDIFRNLTDYDPVAELEALDQLTKANHFLVEWFNTTPDVQEGPISNHFWPSR
jgi:hypothetical protein